jgi:hypothetical protein
MDTVEELPMGDGSGTWGQCTDRLLDDVRADADNSDRDFTAEWARTTQGRMLGVDRHCRQWAESTVLLTPTANTTWPGSHDLLPPVTHWEHLTASRQARRKALSRCLDDVDRWRAVRVLGTTKTGHVGPHVAVFASEPVSDSRFRPWVGAHVDNCPLADDKAHGEGAVRVETEPTISSETGVVGYAMKNVPGLDSRAETGHGLGSEPRHRARTASVIDAVRAVPVRYGRDGGEDGT